MTQQEKARDLAEKVMGWKLNIPWTPFTSRDAAHELLGRLTEEQWVKLAEYLDETWSAEGQWISRETFFALIVRLTLSLTPAQIAEAVWRAVCSQG